MQKTCIFLLSSWVILQLWSRIQNGFPYGVGPVSTAPQACSHERWTVPYKEPFNHRHGWIWERRLLAPRDILVALEQFSGCHMFTWGASDDCGLWAFLSPVPVLSGQGTLLWCAPKGNSDARMEKGHVLGVWVFSWCLHEALAWFRHQTAASGCLGSATS